MKATSLVSALRFSSSAYPCVSSSVPVLKYRRIATVNKRFAGGTAGHSERKGAVLATQSGLFKLSLPLRPPASTPIEQSKQDKKHEDRLEEEISTENPTLFLLHPKQPLSFIGTLIQAELAGQQKNAPSLITFHGADEGASKTPDSSETLQETLRHNASAYQFASSTELGHFIQESAQGKEFRVVIHPSDDSPLQSIAVSVPTFRERTRYLRSQLRQVSEQMQAQLDIKRECDELALQGAKRFAIGGFFGLVGYGLLVYHLTFRVYDWDVMEPVTYLVSVSGLCAGYLWFLYHQKEVSYRSVFEMSSRARREQLYRLKGFDEQHWKDLVHEATTLRRTIQKIAADYDVEWRLKDEEGEHAEVEKEIVRTAKRRKEKKEKSQTDREDTEDREKD